MTEPERTTPTIEERVAAGAEWLDAALPDWIRVVDLGRLRLDSPCACILGQTFGDYGAAPLGVRGSDRYDTAASALGFIADEVCSATREDRDVDDDYLDDEYAALTVEWHRLILARREAGRG